jgi:hypothetical protein
MFTHCLSQTIGEKCPKSGEVCVGEHHTQRAILPCEETLQQEVEGKVRRRYRCHHHILNKCRGGTNRKSNLLLMWKDREVLFHQLFGNKTLKEAIAFLNRVYRAKEYQRQDEKARFDRRLDE